MHYIYICDNQKKKVVPPFHYGFAFEMHHQYASKNLIFTLNAYRFSCSYDEVRAFLTSAAKEEIKESTEVYVPFDIINRNLGGSLIQEGDDNVDRNTETINGKNTYHSMARTLFQVQDPNVKQTIPRILVGKNKTLKIRNKNLFQVLPFEKPNKDHEPPRINYAQLT